MISPAMRMAPTTKAFTMVEGLVALALVAIVAVLALTGIGSIRRSYARALDVHRMKQIGSLWLLSIQENQQKLPSTVLPSTFKTLAVKMGYIQSTNDWSNDSATPKNSIFRNGANEKAIRQLFVSGWDDRPNPDPLNSFSHNEYLGIDGTQKAPEEGSAWVDRWNHIRYPERKIFMIPAWFLPRTYANQRFSGATSSNPFRTANNPATKGHFPALFADGHVNKVDPAPDLTLSEINRRWLLPRSEP